MTYSLRDLFQSTGHSGEGGAEKLRGQGGTDRKSGLRAGSGGGEDAAGPAIQGIGTERGLSRAVQGSRGPGWGAGDRQSGNGPASPRFPAR